MSSAGAASLQHILTCTRAVQCYCDRIADKLDRTETAESLIERMSFSISKCDRSSESMVCIELA